MDYIFIYVFIIYNFYPDVILICIINAYELCNCTNCINEDILIWLYVRTIQIASLTHNLQNLAYQRKSCLIVNKKRWPCIPNLFISNELYRVSRENLLGLRVFHHFVPKWCYNIFKFRCTKRSKWLPPPPPPNHLIFFVMRGLTQYYLKRHTIV